MNKVISKSLLQVKEHPSFDKIVLTSPQFSKHYQISKNRLDDFLSDLENWLYRRDYLQILATLPTSLRKKSFFITPKNKEWLEKKYQEKVKSGKTNISEISREIYEDMKKDELTKDASTKIGRIRRILTDLSKNSQLK